MSGDWGGGQSFVRKRQNFIRIMSNLGWLVDDFICFCHFIMFLYVFIIFIFLVFLVLVNSLFKPHAV